MRIDPTRISCRFWAVVVALGLLAGCASVEERTAENIEYVLPVQEAMPGDVISLGLKLPAEVKTRHVAFMNRSCPLFRRQGQVEANYTVYLPVPREAPAGDYAITCTFEVAKGEHPVRENLSIRILPQKKAGETLGVSLKHFQEQAYLQELQLIQSLLKNSHYRVEQLQDFKLPLGGEITGTYHTIWRVNNKTSLPVAGLIIVPWKTSGLDVSAAADGKVLLARTLPMLGNTVLIDHGFSFASLYAHLGRLTVQEGAEVRRGQSLGLAGSSGGLCLNRGLLFRVFVSGVPINPEKFLRVNLY
jgi:murein DD-endopeptidase MepM/ murein hydrolase activator NlpD